MPKKSILLIFHKLQLSCFKSTRFMWPSCGMSFEGLQHSWRLLRLIAIPKDGRECWDFLNAKACEKKKNLYKFPRCVYIKKSMYIYIYKYNLKKWLFSLLVMSLLIFLCIHRIFISYLSTCIYIYVCMLMYILIHFLISLFVHLSIHTCINMMYWFVYSYVGYL